LPDLRTIFFTRAIQRRKILAKTNYSFEKRQKELAKKKKKEEKRQQKLEKQKNGSEDQETPDIREQDQS